MKRAPRELEAGSPAPAADADAQWGVLAHWLRIPREPPAIPPGEHRWARSFRPADAFLTYLRAQYLLVATVFVLMLAPFAVSFAMGARYDGMPVPLASFLITLAAVLVALAVLGFLMIRLHFDTTWYVMTDRSVRLRRGALTIRELTVTLDNVQNVKVTQGPIQRWLGIGNVAVETAAAGPADSQGGGSSASSLILAGVADAPELRDRIVERLRRARSSGLGDAEGPSTADGSPTASPGSRARATEGPAGWSPDGWSPDELPGWTPAHLEALRQIRAEVRRLR